MRSDMQGNQYNYFPSQPMYDGGYHQEYQQPMHYPYPAYVIPMPQPPPTHFSVDVECVATGTDHGSRAVAQVALVDQYGNQLLNRIVRPADPVVSYLTPLTGITQELVEREGIPLEQAIAELKHLLPPYAVLVGLNIRQDVTWLGLKEGVDFQEMKDLQGLYQVWNPKYNSMTRFGLEHLAKVLMNEETGQVHNAASDAYKSIQLWNLYLELQASPERFNMMKEALLNTPVTPSFAKQNPTCEGVCMGNAKTCRCGAPLFLS